MKKLNKKILFSLIVLFILTVLPLSTGLITIRTNSSGISAKASKKVSFNDSVNLEGEIKFYDITSDTPTVITGQWTYKITNNANNAASIEVRMVDSNGDVKYGPKTISAGTNTSFQNITANKKYTFHARAISSPGYYRISITD